MQKSGPHVVTAATSDPVTVAEARDYCLITGTGDGSKLAALISSATEFVQRSIAQQLIAATLLETWDWFPRVLTLERRPLQSVSWVKYYDADGTLTTVSSADYYVDTYARPPRIAPLSGTPWPSVQTGRPAAVQVQYVAGYASADATPASIKLAIKALVKLWYDSPVPVMSSGAMPQEMPYHLADLMRINDQSGYS